MISLDGSGRVFTKAANTLGARAGTAYVAGLALAFAAPAWPAPAPSATAAALAAGDWRSAAQLGASAADVVRALQARGQAADAVPEESVVTIDPGNRVEVVALKPLPPLPGDTVQGERRTERLAGSGFAFSARHGAITLYPADAQTFEPTATP
jgi:hypothetical protein